MPSGGARARSGPAPDPNSYRSLNKDWTDLPADGYTGEVPVFPLPRAVQFMTYFEDGKKVTEADPDETEAVWDVELDLWEELWKKPQAAAWASLGLKMQVAAYVRAFLESIKADAVSATKTTVLRMETELGLSVSGMRQNGWRIGDADSTSDSASTKTTTRKTAPKRQTPTGEWLKGVAVKGA